MPNGSRYWRLKYRFAGKEKRAALGVYPEVPLSGAKRAKQPSGRVIKGARELRDEARRLLSEGIDPGVTNKREKAKRNVAAAENTFASIGRAWLAKPKPKPKPADSTYTKIVWMLEEHAFPWIGSTPIGQIDPPIMLTMLKRLEARGKNETSQRLKQYCSAVFRFAIGTGQATSDPCRDLRGQLETPKVQHPAAITDPAELAHLIRDIRAYTGSFVTSSALQLAPMLFPAPR